MKCSTWTTIRYRLEAYVLGRVINRANQLAPVLVDCADSLQAHAERLGHRYRAACRKAVRSQWHVD